MSEHSAADATPSLEVVLASLAGSPADDGRILASVLDEVAAGFSEDLGPDRDAAIETIAALPGHDVRQWLVAAIERSDAGDLPHLARLAGAVPGIDVSAELIDAAHRLADTPTRAELIADLAGSDDVRRRILSMQTSDLVEMRMGALELAAELGGDDESVERGLRDPSANVRLAAAELAATHAGRFEDLLLRLAVDDPSPAVRRTAVMALQASDRAIRLEAARPALADSDTAVRVAAGALLRDEGIEEIMLLADALRDDEPAVVAAAADQLAESNPADSPIVLWRALVEGRPTHRLSLLEAIDRLDDASLAAILHRAVRSDDHLERGLGIEVASRRDLGSEMVEIFHAALTDPAVEVRLHALAALSSRLDEADIERIGDRVHDPAPAVRLEAVRLMRAAADDRNFDSLLHAAGDPVAHVRSLARSALLDRRGTRLTADLIGALADPVRRRSARDLLTSIGGSALEAMIDALDGADDELRAELGAVIREDDHVDLLVGRLGHRDPRTRRRALIALAAAGDADCLPALVGCLDDPVPEIRALAVDALTVCGDRRAVEPLRHALVSDPDLELVPAIEAALRALGDDSVPAEPDETSDDVIIDVRDREQVER